MEIWEIVVLSLVGIVAGWLNVLAGGGSMLTVPIMIFMGMPGPDANGTNRLATQYSTPTPPQHAPSCTHTAAHTKLGSPTYPVLTHTS